MEKNFRGHLVSRATRQTRRAHPYSHKGKKNDAQLSFDFPAVQLLLPLEGSQPFSLPRQRYINAREVERFWLILISQKGFLRK